MSKRLKFPKIPAQNPEGARVTRPASDGTHAMWREHELAVQSAQAHLNNSRPPLVRLMAAVDGIDLNDGWAWNAEFLRWEKAPTNE